MNPGARLIFVFQLVTVVGFVLTSVRLYTSGLFRKYRIFFAFLIFSAVVTGTALTMNTRSALYAWFWFITQPVLWVFYVLIVLELYRLVLENYKGLYTLGRWAMWGSVAVAILLSSLSLVPRLGTGVYQQRSRFLNYYYVIERGVDFSLVLFLLFILLILSRFPVQLSRNVVVHAVVYTAYFLSNTLGSLLRSVFGLAVARSLSTILMGVTAFCVLLWLLFLDEKGEEQRVSLAGLGPQQEERILTSLNALNTTLLRSARK